MAYPTTVVAEVSKRAELVCVAYGIPAPSITWTRASGTDTAQTICEETLNINGTAFTVSVLEFCSVDVTDGDMYNCTASNGEGGDASAVFPLTITDNIEGKDIHTRTVKLLYVYLINARTMHVE